MNEEERRKNYALAERLLAEQNFAVAVLAGAVAALLAAAGYGIVVEVWAFSHGFAAAGIGLVVGLAMQFLGRGIEGRFSAAAAVFTIAGCLLGNLFTVILRLARVSAASPIDVIRTNPLSELVNHAISGFGLGQSVYWLVAVACAVFLAKRPLSRAERLAIGLLDLRDRSAR